MCLTTYDNCPMYFDKINTTYCCLTTAIKELNEAMLDCLTESRNFLSPLV